MFITWPNAVSNESTIWRYMDFSKFVDLLDSQRLFFTRLSKLRKDDPYEGSLVPFYPNYKEGKSSEIIKESDKGLPNDFFVSCWHLSDIESAALWKLYSNSNECIAIKSTVAKLVSSIVHNEGYCNTSIEIKAVEYGHEKARSRNNNSNSVRSFDVVFTKRREFAHEKELRLAIWADTLPTPILPDAPGLKLEVNLESMISEIVIGPEAPDWTKDLVKSISKKYDFSFEIKQSTLLKLTL